METPETPTLKLLPHSGGLIFGKNSSRLWKGFPPLSIPTKVLRGQMFLRPKVSSKVSDNRPCCKCISPIFSSGARVRLSVFGQILFTLKLGSRKR